ncbi:MAG: sensor histidine kinase [Acidobacteriia bacterium]|nr:sensor histidine kinase [Terriglobia bacterium]
MLARDPESVDYGGLMGQLEQADRDIRRISGEGAQTPERDLWARLEQYSTAFSDEARRLLSVAEPETFSSIDLFRYHEAFTSVIARLIEAEYRKVSAARAQIDRRSSRLLRESALFAGGAGFLALLFSGFTVRLVSRLTAAMHSQGEELSRVSWQMLSNQEAAARRFSHELHDELGQELTAIKTNLTALEANGQVNPARLDDSLQLVDEAIGNVRQMSQLLRPTILDDFGLEASLRWLCEGFAARTGIDVRLDSDFPGRLPDETETHLFRIAQEALTNIARHSGAKSAQLNLAAKGAQITLSIQDDGRGLGAARPARGGAPGSGLGMTGMRARARGAGGDLSVRSRPGGGVLIEVRVPIRHETHSHPPG